MSDTFADLPDALVRDLLAKALPVAAGVSDSLSRLSGARTGLRDAAAKGSLIRRKADLDVTREPSIVGVDGSYQLHRLTAVDLCAAAAVAVEGSVREAKRYWPEPYHRMWVEGLPHSKNSTNTLRGLMISMELDLAHEAPHDVILLDGSFIILLIYLNQGLTSVGEAPLALRDEFLRRWVDEKVLERFLDILNSDRAVAVPKYSGRNELRSVLNLDGLPPADGKTLATLLLQPDEYTQPLAIYRFGTEEDEYHLPSQYANEKEQEKMNAMLAAMRVVFYKPYGWTPAVRLEIASAVANSPNKLAMVLEGVKRQFFSPAVTEPYPLFLADRMVKSLGAGVNVVEQTVTQHAVDVVTDTETVMLLLQSYRTEGGRGGV
jgi:hypothetical protein